MQLKNTADNYGHITNCLHWGTDALYHHVVMKDKTLSRMTTGSRNK